MVEDGLATPEKFWDIVFSSLWNLGNHSIDISHYRPNITLTSTLPIQGMSNIYFVVNVFNASLNLWSTQRQFELISVKVRCKESKNSVFFNMEMHRQAKTWLVNTSMHKSVQFRNLKPPLKIHDNPKRKYAKRVLSEPRCQPQVGG